MCLRCNYYFYSFFWFNRVLVSVVRKLRLLDNPVYTVPVKGKLSVHKNLILKSLEDHSLSFKFWDVRGLSRNYWGLSRNFKIKFGTFKSRIKYFFTFANECKLLIMVNFFISSVCLVFSSLTKHLNWSWHLYSFFLVLQKTLLFYSHSL